jgi:hypothetical protein
MDRMINLSNLYPDFIVVGAAKSGTSSLDQYFRQHPDIYMPGITKELNFFHLKGHEDRRAILKRVPYLPTNILSYLGYFYNKEEHQISGECSPSYLIYYDETIKNIKDFHPNWQDLKIIIILREPIDKIWSHYKFVKMKRLDPDNLSLEESLKFEKQRIKNTDLLPDLFYLNNTSYFEQVEAYAAVFKNLKIIKFDDLKTKPDFVMKGLFTYLGTCHDVEIDTTKRHNVSKPILKYRNEVYKKLATNLPFRLHKLIPNRLKKQLKVEEHMSDDLKIQLAKHFSLEIEKLEKLTDIDFSNWRNKYKKILSET